MRNIKESKNLIKRETTSKDFTTNRGKILSQELIHGKGINFVGNIFNV